MRDKEVDTTMEIRKATLEDLERIVQFNYNLAWETEDKRLDLEILKKGVKALIEDERKGVYHVAVEDGNVIGQIMYTYEWSDWRNGLFIWVQSVYVDAAYRNKGIFRALYGHIKAMCDKDSQIAGIRLYVEKENEVAKKTYHSLGMEECNYHMFEYEKK